MKSNKRQFIEKFWPESPEQWDGLEKELNEALAKDSSTWSKCETEADVSKEWVEGNVPKGDHELDLNLIREFGGIKEPEGEWKEGDPINITEEGMKAVNDFLQPVMDQTIKEMNLPKYTQLKNREAGGESELNNRIRALELENESMHLKLEDFKHYESDRMGQINEVMRDMQDIQPYNHCKDCGCEIAAGNEYCGECMCEDDSE